MKFTITKEEFDKLPEGFQGEYQENNGAYTLKLEGHEEAFVPKAKKDEAERHRKEAERQRDEIAAREQKLVKDLENASGAKEIQALRDSHQKEVDRIKAEYDEKDKAAKAEVHKSMVREEASKFAGEKFTVPSAISRLYQDRLTVEEVGGKPVIRVLEEDGSPSVKSLSDLQKEFLENKEFAPIVKASGGSGGGANPSNSKSGGGAAKSMTRSQFDALGDADRMTFSKDGGQLTDD